MHECINEHTRGKTIKPNLDTSLRLFLTTSISAHALFKCPTVALTAPTGGGRVCADVNQLQATLVAQFFFSEFMDFWTLQSIDKMMSRVAIDVNC